MLLQQTAAGGVCALFLLLLQRIFRNLLSPRWQYGIWGVLVLRLLIPVGAWGRSTVLDVWPWLEAARAGAELTLDSAYSSPWTLSLPQGPIPLLPAEAPRSLTDWLFLLYLAGALGLPVIVHDRDAHGDCMAIVREYPQVTGVFHCFSGSAEMARELIGLGWMISFTGVLTYRNARKAVEAAQAVPLEKIMIETDSPYMAPEPCRGKRCDSSLVVHTCRRLAEIKGVSLEECARITLENGRRFFSIQEGGNGTA